MSSEEIESVKALLALALQQTAEERIGFLAGCNTSEAVRGEVERLLALEKSASGFLSMALPVQLGLTSGATTTPLSPGTRLSNRYTIDETLSEGGFASVYLARDQQVASKPVVIKVLDQTILSKEHVRRALDAELKALSSVSHQAVVGVSDVGELDDGTPFLVLQHIPGVTLRAVLKSGRIPKDRGLGIVRQVAQALSAAHRAGVLHLDLKPENIIVSGAGTSDERASVIDFGIARLKDSSVSRAVSGSPGYMAPEQRTGRASERSDIYALGIITRELLGGTLQRRTGAVVARATAPAPEQRFDRVEDFVNALFDAQGVFRKRRSSIAAAISVAAILLALVIGTKRSKADYYKQPVPLTSTPGFEYRPSLSADGRWVFYTVGEPQHRDIYMQSTEGGEATRLTDDPADEDLPTCSPDGTRLLFARVVEPDKTAVVIKELAGERRERVVARAYDIGVMTWVPDQRRAILAQKDREGEDTRLRVLDLETGEGRDLLSPVPGFGGDSEPALSPDGRRLAFVRRHSRGQTDLFVLQLDDALSGVGTPRQVTFMGQRIHSPNWTPDGKELLFLQGVLDDTSAHRIVPDGKSKERAIAEMSGRLEWLGVSRRAWKIAYSIDLSDTNIWRVALGRTDHIRQADQVAPSTHDEGDPRESPDGRHIVFVSSRTGTQQVWLADRNGSSPKQITSFGPVDVLSALWLPDSVHLIVSARDRVAGHRFYKMALFGQPEEITKDGFAVSISRDGQWIYFYSYRSGNPELWKLHLTTRRIQQVTTGGGFSGIESEDGRTLFFSKRDDGEGIWERSFSGGAAKRVIPHVRHPMQFDVRSKGVYYVVRPEGSTRDVLFLWQFSTRRSIPLYTFEREFYFGLDVSPDEQTVLYSQYDVNNSDIMLVSEFR